MRLRRLGPAVAAVQQLVAGNPEAAPAWLLYASVAAAAGNQRAVVEGCGRARLLCDQDVEFRLQLGQILLRAGLQRDALDEALSVSKFDGLSAVQHDRLGTLLSFCGEPSQALVHFNVACNAVPDSPAYLFNLASAQRMNGLLDEAEASLDRVIALRPQDAGAHAMRADLRTQSAASNHVAALTTALGHFPVGSPDHNLLSFALAKELEDLGDFRQSFSWLKRGADAHRASLRYDVAEDTRVLDALIRRHDGAALQATESGCCSDEPIFIVGLPRSGTTLVERILASHPDVYAAGELQAFPQSVRRLVSARLGANPSPVELVEHSLQLEPSELGRAYLGDTRPRTGHTLRFIDKLPTNYLNVVLIRRALPKARIIALRRDPVDSCYAMYKSFLTGPYRFTNDLLDLARYFAAWSRLMKHWDSLPGAKVLTVRYEDVVASPEAASRRLLDHCGLAWDDRCLSFHALRGAVSTASASQVRRPIYSSSVGKWRAYRAELQPLLQALRSLEVQFEE